MNLYVIRDRLSALTVRMRKLRKQLTVVSCEARAEDESPAASGLLGEIACLLDSIFDEMSRIEEYIDLLLPKEPREK